MSGPEDDSEKSFEPTPNKLQKARERGEVARSADLSMVAAYAGMTLVLTGLGATAMVHLANPLVVLIDQSDGLSRLVFDGPASGPVGGLMSRISAALMPIFAVPAVAVILSVVAQRAFVLAPSKLVPKLSRLSIVSNAKNKFGRGGLFEFAKSFVKLVLYSVTLGLYIRLNLTEIVATAGMDARQSVLVMARLLSGFMFLVVAIATVIGVVDALWQHAEHIRKNMMTRKEIMDEMKDAEGDPHVKQQRRQRGQEIAMNQMLTDVPGSDVVIVNPTHYAVALKWSRLPGAAPVCVAKGVDETAAAIRRIAIEAGIPIHSDPPTARALHASVEIGQEVSEAHYRPVAAAIRFAEAMRKRAAGRIG